MKSLDDLREMELYTNYEDVHGREVYAPMSMNAMADHIEDEIFEYFMPRPLYEDGEPLCFGDTVYFGDDGEDDLILKVDSLLYDYLTITLMGIDQRGYAASVSIMEGDRIKRAPKHPHEHDTQDKIDKDVTMPPYAYCDRHGILDEDMDESEATEAMIRHLLERQRKLDGVSA